MPAQHICKGCGKAIHGSYITALNAVWHAEHFLCSRCGKPLNTASFIEHQGLPLHSDCYNHQGALACVYCGKPLRGQYQFDYWGNKFCPEHTKQYPTCRFCGRLVPIRSPHSAGRHGEDSSCSICEASAIRTNDQCSPIFPRLTKWINNQGLQYNNLPLRMELVNRTQLTQLQSQGGNGDALGVTLMQKTISIFGAKTNFDGVGILQGLPSILFQSVAVHELGHVWLGLHNISPLTNWAEEGFCQLLAYRLLTQMSTKEGSYFAKGIEQQADPVYGYGFQYVRNLANTVTFPKLIEVLLLSKKMPVLVGRK
jgi:hypothetical protein